MLEEELSDPKPGEVQVAVKAIGLNFADAFAVVGLYTAAGWKRFIPGLEFAGVVEKVGPNVEYIKVGDRVMGVTRFGAYATALNVDARLAVALPENWSFEEGAAFPVAALTAYYGLVDQCHLQKGETVLIHSAAGGVGIMANRIAKKFVCFTIGLVGSASKVDFCEREGYDKVIVRSRNFRRDLQNALDGRTLSVVMECTGGRFFRESLRALGKRGRMAVYGFAHYMPRGNRIPYLSVAWKYLTRPRVDVFHFNNISVSSFNLIYLFEEADKMREYMGKIAELNIGKPVISRIETFENLPTALKALKSGGTVGKIVVQV
ncbi:MAG TPA: zinc-binding dehydrogenase [Candidatus Paceibacterota bacterium]|nr:zinc-binding dehydrogenase [Candidatus Paceibacterota bacterium]